MAEALANHFPGNHCQAFFAGTEAAWGNPPANRALAELGIYTSLQRSKTISELADQDFENPSQLICSDEAVVPEFRRVRGEIKKGIIDYFGGTQ
jgi:protein-tyrosine-phosphatase